MRNFRCFHILPTFLVLCFLAATAYAEGANGTTSIEYDAVSGNVTAYGETLTLDYLPSDYQAYVSLSVKDQDGMLIANGSTLDLWNGDAEYVLTFAAVPGSTYCATSYHKAQLYYWDYAYTFPYQQQWFDAWYMSYFTNQNIDWPLNYFFQSPGYYQYRRNSSMVTIGKTHDCVAVPSVQKIQYKTPGTSTYVDITGTQYVLKGTTVEFKAIPNPNTATFPSGQPVWSGTSGATGTGVTKSVTFNSASSSSTDYKIVTVTAAGAPVTVNVIVYDLTGTLIPEDNFSGRSVDRYGLKERVGLS